MYNCIEGIKGAGKSTVTKLTYEELKGYGLQLGMICPTQRSSSCSWYELAFRLLGNACPDSLVEYVYARRSDAQWKNRNKNASLLIGDRSILTSYVARFSFAQPLQAIERVNRRERSIALPDCVFVLELDSQEALRRIAKRPKRRYGFHDESLERLEYCAQAYRYLARDADQLGLSSIQWEFIDASRDPETIAMEITERILDQHRQVYTYTNKDNEVNQFFGALA
jgi:thymidylate kinase